MFTNDESVKKVGSINQIVYLRNLLFLHYISYNLTSYHVHCPYWSHCWTFRKIFYKLNLSIFYSSHLCAFFSLLSDRTPGSRGRREFFHLTSWSSVCRPRTMIIWGQMLVDNLFIFRWRWYQSISQWDNLRLHKMQWCEVITSCLAHSFSLTEDTDWLEQRLVVSESSDQRRCQSGPGCSSWWRRERRVSC